MTSITPVTPLSSGSNITNPPSASASNPNDSLASEDTFLKLLVAQIQNQDPTNPTDPVQFVGQLTQYSELEQLMQINSGVSNLTSAADASGAVTSTPPAGTTATPNNPLAPNIAVGRTQQQEQS
jgi:flagellar basal-body rod modification protein FlgD